MQIEQLCYLQAIEEIVFSSMDLIEKPSFSKYLQIKIECLLQ
jgi:hypothetical protein